MPVTTVLRLALGLVFVVAAVGKLADRTGTVAAARALGVPARVARPVAGVVLPVAELALAAALGWEPSAVVGATGAMFLLALMTGLVALNLIRGRRPPCHCFGHFDDAPIGAGTIVRNAVLMAIAIVVIVTA